MDQTTTANVTITNKLGLHARPAMLFVEVASRYDAGIEVRRADSTESVNGKSIMEMMMLAATQGTEIVITACGSDAEGAIKDLVQLVDSGFEED